MRAEHESVPADTPPVPARVPGAAQLDWLAAAGTPLDVYAEDGPERLRALEEYRWWYRARLPRCGSSAHLVIGGVDFAFRVLIDGRTVLSARGMYTEHVLPLPEGAQVVELVVEPPPVDLDPPVPGALWDWTRERRGQARRATRPLVSYGDDYQPRAVTAGPWQEVLVEERPDAHVASFTCTSRVELEPLAATVQPEVVLGGAVPSGATLRLTLTARPADHVLVPPPTIREWPATVTPPAVEVPEPLLWWPWELGDQTTYLAVIELLVDGSSVDELSELHAFRRVELVVHDGGWVERAPEAYPKSRIEPPHTLLVNGRRLFVKGVCMAPPTLFPHEGNRERYEALVGTVRRMNFNLIKNSGGGIVHKDDFYTACDETGILVWQDFPLSCNEYPEDHEYLDLLTAEATSIVRRLRRHPSTAVWCGGNELFTPWSRMTEQHQAIRTLNAVALALDPLTPFVASTPQQGATHGYYMFANPDDEHTEGVQYIHEADATAYMEVGCPAPASAELLRRLIPEGVLFPPEPDPMWRLRSAQDAWDGRLDTWLCWDLAEEVTGPASDVEDFVDRAQRMQAGALQQVVEEARRQQPRCAAVCIWVLNEPWPNAANLSITSYPAEPKQAVERLAAAGRPALLSLRLPHLRWAPDADVRGELWLLDDRSHDRPRRIEWCIELLDGGGGVVDNVRGSATVDGDAGPAARLATWTLRLPPDGPDLGPPFSVAVRCLGAAELGSDYPLFVRPRWHAIEEM